MNDLLPFLTPAALAGLAVYGIIRGWIYPRRVVDGIIETYEGRLADREAENERLREINAIETKRNDMLLEQVRLMVDANRTSNAALLALPGVLGNDGTRAVRPSHTSALLPPEDGTRAVAA